MMQVFAVGGAVRDELLGLSVQDRDYVVVGASPEEMLARGFKPVESAAQIPEQPMQVAGFLGVVYL